MTRDEILAMEPGRELDRLAAKWIFRVDDPDPRWSPSTNIAHAFEVWEHDRSEDWIFDLSYLKGQYYAEIFKPYVGVLAKARAKTAPEAICKAALLAVMDGEDEHERD